MRIHLEALDAHPEPHLELLDNTAYVVGLTGTIVKIENL